MAAEKTQKYLDEEKSLGQECKELISSLPRQIEPFNSSYLYQYQGFWFKPDILQGVISCQKHLEAQDSDVFLATHPKCGTTWLKAIIFTLLNWKLYPVESDNHPLRTTNPHDLVLFLEINPDAENQIYNPASTPSRRFFATHTPYVSLPGSLKNNSSKCKVVYVARNPRDTFVSLWHFRKNIASSATGADLPMGEEFEKFCEGVVVYGPFWDHVLEYWEQSRESPEKVLFVKYEDMKKEPAVELRRMAEFLDCPFSAEEEEAGLVEKILELTSFDSMSGMEVNRSGVVWSGVEKRHFFWKGVVGDGKKYLSADMVEKLDGIMREKFFGSGLVL